MPISHLYVEGEIDAVLMNRVVSLMDAPPVVTREGSKNSLRPKVIAERSRPGGLKNVYYLRDRDFDFDVVPGSTEPQQESSANFDRVGWHWSRHEIENYLLEPRIVKNILPGKTLEEISDEIVKAAVSIREYAVARWTLGSARRVLPPHYELSTRPFGKRDNEIKVPSWSVDSCREWVSTSTADYLSKVEGSLGAEEIQERYELYQKLFNSSSGTDITWVLYMYPGKDLFASAESWFKSLGFVGAGSMRALIVDWIASNPEQAVSYLPEWAAMLEELKT